MRSDEDRQRSEFWRVSQLKRLRELSRISLNEVRAGLDKRQRVLREHTARAPSSAI